MVLNNKNSYDGKITLTYIYIQRDVKHVILVLKETLV